jgi:hypothetical protein
MWHMRRACGGRRAGTELQVHGRNTEARACYERLGGRRQAAHCNARVRSRRALLAA